MATGNTEVHASPFLERWLESCAHRSGLWLSGIALLLAIQISSVWYATPDGVQYLSIARSIAAPDRMTNLGNPEIGAAIGYPLLVSPLFFVGERPFLLLSLAQWVFAVIFMLGVYRWARAQLGDGALLVTGLVMVNVTLWNIYRRTLSELAFMMWMIWTIQAYNAVLTASSSRGAIRRALVASAMMVFLSVIREPGILLAAGFAVAALRQVRRRMLSWGTAAALLAIDILAALIAIGLVRPERTTGAQKDLRTYLAGFETIPMLEWLVESLRLRVSQIGQLIVPGMFKAYGERGEWLDPNLVVYGGVFVIIAIGWWRLVRRYDDALALTFPFFFALHLVWPFEDSPRYLLPMLPLLFACVWFCLESLSKRRLTILAILLLLHLGVATGYWLGTDRPRARECHRHWLMADRLAAPIRADPGPVRPVDEVGPILSLDVPECVTLMLSAAVDRAIPVLHSHTQPPASVRWIIMPQDTPPPSNFHRHSRFGAYILLELAES